MNFKDNGKIICGEAKSPPKPKKEPHPPKRPKTTAFSQWCGCYAYLSWLSRCCVNFSVRWVGVNIRGTASFWNTLNGQYLWPLGVLSHATGPTLLAGTDSKVKHSQPVSRVTLTLRLFIKATLLSLPSHHYQSYLLS